VRDLFGNPPDGTFLAWFADHGLWALLAAVAAVTLWYVIHRLTAGGPNGAGRDGDMANARQKADALSKLEG
jgi:hypothetical protein